MSEKENKTNASTGSAVVMVEKTSGSRHVPYRPTELQEEPPPDPQHKRSKAPAVPSAGALELKHLQSSAADDVDATKRHSNEVRKSEDGASVVKHTRSSSKMKQNESTPDSIAMASLDVAIKKIPIPPTLPIPDDSQKVLKDALSSEKVSEKKGEEDISRTEELDESRTAGPADIPESEIWSDEEEAGTLRRSESRASRVSRAMRQLFCCSAVYEAPSEDDISGRRDYTGI